MCGPPTRRQDEKAALTLKVPLWVQEPVYSMCSVMGLLWLGFPLRLSMLQCITFTQRLVPLAPLLFCYRYSTHPTLPNPLLLHGGKIIWQGLHFTAACQLLSRTNVVSSSQGRLVQSRIDIRPIECERCDSLSLEGNLNLGLYHLNLQMMNNVYLSFCRLHHPDLPAILPTILLQLHH